MADPTINADDFGAVGDGVTDDSQALNRAGEALTNQRWGLLNDVHKIPEPEEDCPRALLNFHMTFSSKPCTWCGKAH